MAHYAHNVDDSILHGLCSVAQSEEDWEDIRHWFQTNPIDVKKRAAEYVGDLETTPLHVVCKHSPPLDIIHELLNVSPDTIEWIDAFVWVPLHYASANGASVEVLRALTEACPSSRTAVDKRGRTPLHFAVGTMDRQASKEAVEILLSESGAARCADENGSLPIHYACAYSSSAEVLEVLLNAVPASSSAVDYNGCTPLHFAMGNSAKESSPAIINFLLSKNSSVINQTDNLGHLPLSLLANQAKKIGPDVKSLPQRTYTMKCLNCYLAALTTKESSADFLTAMQSLPEWLLDNAVISEKVQSILNYKISQRFPTAILLLDLYMYIILIVCFRLAVYEFLDCKYNKYDSDRGSGYMLVYLTILVLGASYFALRELIQMISLIILDQFSSWYSDTQNLIDTVLITVVAVAVFIIATYNDQQVEDNYDSIVQFFAIVTAILWLSVLAFLKATKIEFAVFVRGVSYVAQTLVTFITALMIILLMFSQLYVTLYQNTEWCPTQLSEARLQELMYNHNVAIPGFGNNAVDIPNFDAQEICDVVNQDKYTDYFYAINPETGNIIDSASPKGEDFCINNYLSRTGLQDFPFCNFESSFIRVNTMLFGEVNDADLQTNVSIVFFFIFLLLVIILLANVLIAIVTDSYNLIRDQKADIVFWNNRLDFVAEMDTIAYSLKKFGGSWCNASKKDTEYNPNGLDVVSESVGTLAQVDGHDFGKEWWDSLMSTLSDPDNLSPTSFEFWIFFLTRIVAAFVIVPIWFFLGVVTVGILWPPQVRERVLVANTRIDADALSQFQAKTNTSLKILTDSNEKLKAEFAELNGIMKKILDFQA